MSNNPFIGLSGAKKSNNPFMGLSSQGGQGSQEDPNVAPRGFQGPSGSSMSQPSGMAGTLSSFLDPVGAIARDPQGAAQSSSGFMDKVEIMNRGFQRVALGGLQLLNRGVRETAGRFSDSINQDSLALDRRIDASNQRGEQRYQDAYARTPSLTADIIGKVGGAVLGTAPLMGSGGGALATIGRGIAGGVLGGAEDYSANDKERMGKMAMGGALGGALSGAAVGISAAGQSLFPSIGTSSFVKKMFQPKAAAIQDRASDIVTDAGDDVGAALAKVRKVQAEGTMGRTPGEAIPGVVTRAHELSSVADDIDKAAVSKVAQASQNYGKKEIYSAIARMATPKVKTLQNDSFKAMEEEFVSPEGVLSNTPSKVAVEKTSPIVSSSGAPIKTLEMTDKYIPEIIKDDKILTSNFKKVMAAQSEKWNNLPSNSVAKLHKVKDLIDDELYKAEPNKAGVITKEISPDRENALIEAKNKLTRTLEQSPSYNAAMAATQKIKTQEWYEAAVRSKAVKAGQGGKLSVDELHQALFNTTAQKQKFIRDVAATGGNPEQAQKVLQLSDSLRQSPTMRILKRMNDGESIVAVYGKDVGVIQKFISKLTVDKYRKALLDVTLSGDQWADDIAKVLSTKGEIPKAKEFYKMILKVSGQGAATAATTEQARKMNYGVQR